VGGLVATVLAQPALQDVLQELHSSKEGSRARAARALVTSGYPEAPSELVALLADPADSVQLAAIDGLVAVALSPAPNPATPLKAVRGSIAWSVFEAGPLAVLPRTWPPLTVVNLSAALRDEDARVREAAAGSLAVIASAGGATLSVESRPAVATDIVHALRHPDVHVRESIARTAGAIFTPVGGASVPVAVSDVLIAALNDDERVVRIEAAEALGWLREARAEQALRDRFAFYRTGSEAEAALHALARIAGVASADVFREALTSSDPAYRVLAAEGLGRLRDRPALATLSRLVARERDPTVLLADAFAFYLLGEHANLGQLVEGLVQPDLTRQARAYLTELGAAVAPELQSWLRHDQPAIRRAVAEVLGLSGHTDSEAALQPLARGDVNRAVAEAARQAMLRLRALPQGVRTR
jgi:HEAT repeat protein